MFQTTNQLWRVDLFWNQCFQFQCVPWSQAPSTRPGDTIVQHQKCMAKATENEEANNHHATDFLHLRWCRIDTMIPNCKDIFPLYMLMLTVYDKQMPRILLAGLLSLNEETSAFFSDQSSLPPVLWFLETVDYQILDGIKCSHDQQRRKTTTNLHRLTKIHEFWLTLRGKRTWLHKATWKAIWPIRSMDLWSKIIPRGERLYCLPF